MIYADEQFYKDKYLLGRKPVIRDGFLFYARQASIMIDQHTFGRLMGVTEIPEVVQMCCCELAETEYRRETLQAQVGGKTSEKVDSYAVTYASTSDVNKIGTTSEQRKVVVKWLADTGLCYRGIDYVYKR